MENTADLIWVALIGNLVLLNFKIIWEWLKGRKNGGVPVQSTCPVHGTFQNQLETLEDSVKELDKDGAARGAAVEVELKNINKQLEKMDKLDDTVDEIKIDLAAFMAEIRKAINNAG